MKTYVPLLIYLSLCSLKEKQNKTKHNTNNTKKKEAKNPQPLPNTK